MRNGRNPKSPAFQFYPGDYLSDRNVVAMTMEERGVHLTLLCSQWIDGPLPADPAKLARLVHLTPEAFARVWPAVSPCFDVLGEGTIANGRMERERAFQAEGRERRIEASKIATEARLAKECDSNRARIEHESSPPLSPTPETRSPTPHTRDPKPDSLSPAMGERAARAPRGVRIDPDTYPIPTSLDSPEFRSALKDYLLTRKGGVWHQTLADVSIRKMVGWGRERAIAALQNSQGAQGLFEPSGGRASPSLFKRPEPPVPVYRDAADLMREAEAKRASLKATQ